MPSLIPSAVERFQEIVIFGTGARGQELKRLWREHGGTIACFSDNDANKWGTTVDELPVIPPKSERMKQANIVIASFAWKEIRQELLANGYKSVNVYLWDMDATWSQFPQISESFFRAHSQELDEVLVGLADEPSRRAYVSALKAHHLRDMNYIMTADYPLHGHPLVTAEMGDIIINGGAFNGDTDLFFHSIASNCRIYSFEPHGSLFEQVVKTATRITNGKTVPINKGLWNDSGHLRFSQSDGLGGSSSVVLEPVRSQMYYDIEVVSIDDFCTQHSIEPNLIKMDIEGAEVKALEGAMGCIRKHRPKLQIAINHTPLQRIQIPLLLQRELEGYTFYVGHHTEENPGETVLYCRP